MPVQPSIDDFLIPVADLAKLNPFTSLNSEFSRGFLNASLKFLFIILPVRWSASVQFSIHSKRLEVCNFTTSIVINLLVHRLCKNNTQPHSTLFGFGWAHPYLCLPFYAHAHTHGACVILLFPALFLFRIPKLTATWSRPTCSFLSGILLPLRLSRIEQIGVWNPFFRLCSVSLIPLLCYLTLTIFYPYCFVSVVFSLFPSTMHRFPGHYWEFLFVRLIRCMSFSV